MMENVLLPSVVTGFFFSLQICFLLMSILFCSQICALPFLTWFQHLVLFFHTCPWEFDPASTFCTFPSCVSGHWRPRCLAKLITDHTSYPPTVWDCLCLYPKHHFFKELPTLLNSFCFSHVSHENLPSSSQGLLESSCIESVWFELIFPLVPHLKIMYIITSHLLSTKLPLPSYSQPSFFLVA